MAYLRELGSVDLLLRSCACCVHGELRQSSNGRLVVKEENLRRRFPRIQVANLTALYIYTAKLGEAMISDNVFVEFIVGSDIVLSQ